MSAFMPTECPLCEQPITGWDVVVIDDNEVIVDDPRVIFGGASTPMPVTIPCGHPIRVTVRRGFTTLSRR